MWIVKCQMQKIVGEGSQNPDAFADAIYDDSLPLAVSEPHERAEASRGKAATRRTELLMQERLI